jgi:AcrR family transcriptional regulator
MSPRPRKASDEEVFAAAYRAMNRLGPGELTLADIAREAGVTASALVQRFGSKRDLLLRLSGEVAGGAAHLFAGLREAHRSPLATLFAYADCMADLGPSPAALARNLSWLLVDLTDPAFRKNVQAQTRATEREIRKLIEAAFEAGELRQIEGRRVSTAALARTIAAIVGGSLLNWAFHEAGTARHWIRKDLGVALSPWKPVSRGAREG